MSPSPLLLILLSFALASYFLFRPRRHLLLVISSDALPLLSAGVGGYQYIHLYIYISIQIDIDMLYFSPKMV